VSDEQCEVRIGAVAMLKPGLALYIFNLHFVLCKFICIN